VGLSTVERTVDSKRGPTTEFCSRLRASRIIVGPLLASAPSVHTTPPPAAFARCPGPPIVIRTPWFKKGASNTILVREQNLFTDYGTLPQKCFERNSSKVFSHGPLVFPTAKALRPIRHVPSDKSLPTIAQKNQNRSRSCCPLVSA